jgi:hypothetical protein
MIGLGKRAIAGRPAHDHRNEFAPALDAYSPLCARVNCTFVDQFIARKLQA